MARTEYDLIIVGLGVGGTWTLKHAADRGLSVLAIEQFEIGHEAGSSSGTTRQFRRWHYRGATQRIPDMAEGLELWDELEHTSGGAGIFSKFGALTIGPTADPRMQALSGVKYPGFRRVPLREASERWPQHRLDETDSVLFDVDGGLVRPLRAITALIDQARRCGAEVLEREPVLEIVPGRRPRVVTAGGEYDAKRVIVSAGQWTSALLPSLAPRLTVKRIVLHWLRSSQPELYPPSRFPVGIRYGGLEADYSFFPQVDELGFKINYYFPLNELRPPAGSPAEVESLLSQRVAALAARELAAVLPDSIVSAALPDVFTKEEEPIVTETGENVIAVTGFSGHGITHAPAFTRRFIHEVVSVRW